jgi:hypothetical protein
MKLKNMILSTALLPFLAFAANQPVAPTMNDVSSFSNCASYAQSVGTYLQNSKLSNGFINSMWFNGIAQDMDAGGTAIITHNGVSTTYTYVAENGEKLSGQTYACDVLKGFSGSTQVKNQLLKNISKAYKEAMADEAINTNSLAFTGYGVYGPTNACSIPNGKYSNCTLFSGTVSA